MNRNDKRLLAVASVGEAAIGLALVVNPPIVARLLFGAELSLVGTAMSRVAGISLLAMGWACWPGIGASRSITALLTYSLLVTVYLGFVDFVGKLVGPFLWPAFVLHAVLTALLGRAWLKSARHQVLPASGSSESR